MTTKQSIYVNKLNDNQAEDLLKILKNRGWEIEKAPHTHWRARQDKTTIAAYLSGKLVVQGKETEDTVKFIIEPEVLKKASFGYQNVLAETENRQMFEPHIGVDESGKGDYFGPLVIAAVYVKEDTARKLLELGIRDSKKVGGDKKIADLDHKIKQVIGDLYSIIPIGPETYNKLQKKIGNLNRLLGWGHAKAMENLLEKIPDCPRAISDKFGNESAIRNALQQRGKQINLIQIPRAEKDVAVAAASILARCEFVRRLDKLGGEIGIELPKGANPRVVETARQAIYRHGRETLGKIAKLHFRTTEKVINA